MRGRGRNIILLAVLLPAVLLSPFALVGVAVWASSESWELEGHGLGYLLLVRGSRLDQLGLFAPTPALPRYSVKLEEGTDPGSRFVAYTSFETPSSIARAYAARCGEMGLKVVRFEHGSTSSTGATETSVVCDITADLDVKVWASRNVGHSVTDVTVHVWGSE